MPDCSPTGLAFRRRDGDINDGWPSGDINDPSPTGLRRHVVKGYGWRPDHPDERDQFYQPVMEQRWGVRIDLAQSGFCPPVYDQGHLASCTANAIAAAIQFARNRQGLDKADLLPSRLFIYLGERVIERTVDSDAGACLRDGIKVVAKEGYCFETGDPSWPYDIERFKEIPPEDCFRDAKRDEVVSYRRLRQIAAHMEDCLAQGFPFVFGFTAFKEIESEAVGKSGMLPPPEPGDQPIGGHSVMAVGYDRDLQMFKIRNSWGAGWGDKGYFWMPYSYVTNPKYAGDFWTIRLVKNV
jgi:C1A family cysteine protease